MQLNRLKFLVTPFNFITNLLFSDDQESDSKEGPRRSTRIRVKPVALRDEPEEELVEPKQISKKKRKKGEMKGKANSEDELVILSEDIAPIFLKKKWEEEARAVKKAKQEFLFSGVPEVLKQQTAALAALEQRPVEIFPKISHVTQAGSQPWRLPYPESLVLRKSLPHSKKINRPTTFASSLNSNAGSIHSACNRSISPKQASYLEWRFCKEWITRMKEDHSLSFPFFRTLRTLLPRANMERDGDRDLPWTDAYAPKQSADILANNRMSSQQLKNWLNQWKLRAGEEVAAPPKKVSKKVGKRKRIASDCTDSEDAVVDEKSNSSWNPEEEEVINCFYLLFIVSPFLTAFFYFHSSVIVFSWWDLPVAGRRPPFTPWLKSWGTTFWKSMHPRGETARLFFHTFTRLPSHTRLTITAMPSVAVWAKCFSVALKLHPNLPAQKLKRPYLSYFSKM